MPAPSSLFHPVLAASWFAASVLTAAPFAQAQSARAPQQHFEIPASTLAEALTTFALQSGLQLSFTDESVRGLRAVPISADDAPMAVLEHLLSGTGLNFTWVNESTLTVHKPPDASISPPPTAMEPAAPPSDEITRMGTITVTGSHIVGARQSGTLPVSVLQREALDAIGAVTVGELVATLPQSGGQAFNNESQGPNQARGDVASANLRGLGSGNTLVLLNGRRMVAHPTTQQEGSVPVQIVNLNTLPGAALRRIDILRDGAGATYGSDATAGIVNHVLDTRFDGVEVSARYGTSEGTALDEASLWVKLGGAFNQGATHMSLTAEGFQRSAMPATDRHYARSDNLSSRVDGRYASSFDNRSALTPWLRGRLAVPVTDFGAPFTAFHLQPCTLPGSGPGSGTQGVCIDGGSSAIDAALRTDEAPERTLTPSSKRLNLLSTFEHDFTSGAQAFAELLYYHADSSAHRGGSSTLTSAPLTIGADNPYNPFGAGPGRDPGYSGPAQAVQIVGLRVDDVGRRRIDVESSVYRVLTGLRGELGHWWNWEAAVLYSSAETIDVERNRVSNRALQAALNSADPATAYNPFNGGNLVDPTRFDTSPNPARVTDPLRIDVTRESTATLALADFTVSNSAAFTLRGQEVGVALGAETRRETFADDRDPRLDGSISHLLPDGTRTSDVMGTSPTPDTRGSRRVHSVFAELQIPLLSAEDGWPLAHSIELQLAARFERISDISEDVLKPRAALAWRFNDQVMLRGAYSEGFRAPNLETVNASQIRRVQENLTDLYACALAQGVNAIAAIDRSACAAHVYNLEDVRSGNPALKSETSRMFSLGLVLNPLRALTLTLDMWRIRQDGIVGVFEAQDHLNLDAVQRLSGGAANPALTRDAGGAPMRIANRFLNLDSRVIEGIDLGVLYALPGTRLGRFDLALDIAWLERFDQTASAEARALLAAGLPASTGGSLLKQNGNPRARASASVHWSAGNWGAHLFARHVGSIEDTSALNYLVKDWTTVNAAVRYAVPSGVWKGITLRAGVNNIAGHAPPLADETFGYMTGLHSNRGRFWHVSATWALR